MLSNVAPAVVNHTLSKTWITVLIVVRLNLILYMF